MNMKSLLLLLGSMWMLNGVFAKDIPPRPQTMVNDYAGVLSPAELNSLEQKLRAYEDSTTTQIAIVIDKSLEGEDAFEYSFRLAQAWGIGQKDKDNGVLIYIAQAERKIRIVTNVGVQGFLTDALSKRIIENTIKPAFQKGQYYAGLDGAVNNIIQIGAGEFKDEGPQSEGGGAISFLILLLIIGAVIFMFSYLSRRSANAGRGYSSDGRYNDRGYGPGGGWFIFPGGGGFGGDSSDRNSGFGGDDWGGFGGSDGFDGGGAGGDW